MRAALALLLLWLAPRLALAHEFSPALLRLQIRDREVQARLQSKDPLVGVRLRGCRSVRNQEGLILGAELGRDARATFRCPSAAQGLELSALGLERSPGGMVVKVVRERGAAHFAVRAGAPTLRLPGLKTPPPARSLGGYLTLGIEHIATGADHLAFVLGLLVLVGFGRRTITTITAFTLAHAVALAVALGGWALPGPWVEMMIALSIVALARSLLDEQRTDWAHRAPHGFAFGFGLLHGLGFFGALQELELSGVLSAMFSFNLGVELGQLGFVFLAWALAVVAKRWIAAMEWDLEVLALWGRRGLAYGLGAVAAAVSIARLERMFWALVLIVPLTACKKEAPEFPDSREQCEAQDPQKKVLFGDLHVHTSFSFDAWVFDVRATPEDAYRFARGEPLALPPLDASGAGTQTLRLARPLDFAAVTDHSEYLGEVEICTDPSAPGYDARTCERYRRADEDTIVTFGLTLTRERPSRFSDVCEGGRCAQVGRTVWARIQQAAEEAYDRSEDCSFTSFVGYEYTAVTGASNLHRNVIFRNDQVPEFAASYFDFPTTNEFWGALDRSCLARDNGCDVLAIPHNSNWSNGNMFFPEYPGARGTEDERSQASLRNRIEPLFEVFQHKGDAECQNGLSGIMGPPDELCDFEKLRPDAIDCGDETGFGGVGGVGCVSRLDFLRGILIEGLKEERRLGVNPYRLGVIASTDTHNGTPGAVQEDAYIGHWGNNEDLPERRLNRGGVTPGGVIFSGGGLTAVWAEENSRNAIFDALKRREAYGTSGPRITVRFFGGDDYAPDLCERAELVEQGYKNGVPMGGDLPAIEAGSAPSFVVSAMQDPGTAERPGTPLQKLQVIKGWVDAQEQAHVQVYDVAQAPSQDASVDLNTCEPQGTGASTLCTVWKDPDFDVSEPAYYYVRVVENPVCRWSWTECLKLPEDQRPESCGDPAIAKTLQERAWTSPIWYQPPE